MTSIPPRDDDTIDVAAVKRAFGRAAATYDAAAVLQREVGARMAKRLDIVRLEPQALVDVGCGTGDALAELGRRYPTARRVAVDLALPMAAAARARHGRATPALRRLVSGLRGPVAPPPAFVVADMSALPFAAGTYDLAWSNLALQWAPDLPRVIRELHRVLRLGGLVSFTTFGPDTLKELRHAFAGVDGSPHVSRFIDMHDIGDLLVHAGFADPVMEMELITLTYADPLAMVRDLKAIGATNAARGRSRGLLGRERWSRVLAALEALRKGGRIAATFEVVYGHAWKSAPTRTAEGLPIVRLERRR